MNEFLESIINRDPAARSKLSVILTYPGAKAVFFHRIANFFCVAKFFIVARILGMHLTILIFWSIKLFTELTFTPAIIEITREKSLKMCLFNKRAFCIS